MSDEELKEHIRRIEEEAKKERLKSLEKLCGYADFPEDCSDELCGCICYDYCKDEMYGVDHFGCCEVLYEYMKKKLEGEYND